MASVADIHRQRAGVPGVMGVRSDGQVVEESPFDRAVREQQELMAQVLRNRTSGVLGASAEVETAKLEAERAKAELDKLTAEARTFAVQRELQELRASQQQAAAQPDGTMVAILKMLSEDRNAALQQAQAAQQQLFATVLAELEEARKVREAPPPPAPTADLAGQITAIKGVAAALADLMPKGPTMPASPSTHDVIELERFRLDADVRRTQLAEEHALRVRELAGRETREAAELDIRRRQVEAEQARANKLGDLVENVAPGLVTMFAQNVMGGGNGDGPAAASGGQAQEQRISVTCTTCGGVFFPKVGETYVACPHCHQAFQLQPDG